MGLLSEAWVRDAAPPQTRSARAGCRRHKQRRQL